MVLIRNYVLPLDETIALIIESKEKNNGWTEDKHKACVALSHFIVGGHL